MNLPDLVRQSLAARTLRCSLFGKELCVDPAWDMLLKLFLATLEDRRMATSDLCIVSGVSVEAALRWLEALRSGEFVRTYPDVADRPGFYVELTPEGLRRMNLYYKCVPDHSA